jgi:hypothetical protein
LIVLDIIGNVSPRDFWNTIDLDNIEPFTIVVSRAGSFQLRWNGAKKAIQLDTDKRHIGLLLLYSEEIRGTFYFI